MNISFDIDGIKSFLKELEDDGLVESGVSVEGPAAAYAEVWEFGNMRQTKKGPRTVLGTNPRGESVWLSSQAPYGFLWVNELKYWRIVENELKKVSFSGDTKKVVTRELESATVEIAGEIAKVVSDAAPVDSGQLSESFRAIENGDPLLEE